MNFNDYSKTKKSNEKTTPEAKKMFSDFLSKYNGKSEDEIIDAIFKTAKENKANGNLSSADIDNFANMLLPMLNASQREKLQKVVGQLKNG